VGVEAAREYLSNSESTSPVSGTEACVASVTNGEVDDDDDEVNDDDDEVNDDDDEVNDDDDEDPMRVPDNDVVDDGEARPTDDKSD